MEIKCPYIIDWSFYPKIKQWLWNCKNNYFNNQKLRFLKKRKHFFTWKRKLHYNSDEISFFRNTINSGKFFVLLWIMLMWRIFRWDSLMWSQCNDFQNYPKAEFRKGSWTWTLKLNHLSTVLSDYNGWITYFSVVWCTPYENAQILRLFFKE